MTMQEAQESFSPENWAHQALLSMDDAEALLRWASVSMPDVQEYKKAAEAFWAVVHHLAAERERLQDLLDGQSDS